MHTPGWSCPQLMCHRETSLEVKPFSSCTRYSHLHTSALQSVTLATKYALGGAVYITQGTAHAVIWRDEGWMKERERETHIMHAPRVLKCCSREVVALLQIQPSIHVFKKRKGSIYHTNLRTGTVQESHEERNVLQVQRRLVQHEVVDDQIQMAL